MNTVELPKPKKVTLHFSWKDTPSIQRLLDVVCSILVEEYLVIAKQNPDVFLKQGDPK